MHAWRVTVAIAMAAPAVGLLGLSELIQHRRPGDFGWLLFGPGLMAMGYYGYTNFDLFSGQGGPADLAILFLPPLFIAYVAVWARKLMKAASLKSKASPKRIGKFLGSACMVFVLSSAASVVLLIILGGSYDDGGLPVEAIVPAIGMLAAALAVARLLASQRSDIAANAPPGRGRAAAGLGLLISCMIAGLLLFVALAFPSQSAGWRAFGRIAIHLAIVSVSFGIVSFAESKMAMSRAGPDLLLPAS